MRVSLIAALLALVTCLGALAQTTAPATELDPKLPTLWIIGDSTVRVGTKGQMGWGEEITGFFDTSRINVVNRAIGGRSSRTFRTDGRWEQILKEAKAGDFVIMQFGHNDPAPLSGDNRERGTIRGMGDETEEVTLTLGAKKGQKEVVHSFGWYMKTYATEAKEKRMTPIICSYIPRCPRPASTASTTQPSEPLQPDTGELSSYRLWAKESADATGATFIDLFGIVRGKWVGMTPEQIKQKYYSEADYTHTSPAGAAFNAACVVEGLRATDSPLKQYLNDK